MIEDFTIHNSTTEPVNEIKTKTRKVYFNKRRVNQETATQITSYQTTDIQPKFPPDILYSHKNSIQSATQHDHESSIKIKKLQCDLCEKSFINLLELDQHRAYEHLINLFVKSRPYKCSECSFTFVKKEHMINHRNVAHKGLEPAKTLKPSTSVKLKPKEAIKTTNPSAKKLKLDHEVFNCQTCDFFCQNELFMKRHNSSKIHKSNELKKMEDDLNSATSRKAL